MKEHPCTRLFPAMDDETFAALVADIAKHGLREPIIVDQHDRVVDGLNRHKACLQLEMVPKFERRTLSDGEALVLSISRNLHRRHLSDAQRAAIAAELATRKQGGHQPANLPDAVSQGQAASLMDVSERAVRSAVKVKREAPELHEQVKGGIISLHAAEKKLRERAGRFVEKRARKPEGPSVARHESDSIPAVYAPLYAELEALPQHLSDHPLHDEHASELVALLTEAANQIKCSTPDQRKTSQ